MYVNITLHLFTNSLKGNRRANLILPSDQTDTSEAEKDSSEEEELIIQAGNAQDKTISC